ncbi:30S ribosomal protein S5 [bacterium (Candidatus Gribaldobacteria) CG_4_9_14_3_um_filter_36_15]|uniref:Small ribosomal subunit protein uS5 n=4 Tax=Candidatus Gribaldobacteria TaxID=2798536 RepID=A0A2M7VK91_9BACT|nr:MAG: 30S ribosomal protein S5 [Parcubacteria group bacterium CG2_30_36_21]PIR91349.1 MAG: 30S ribosomal protein S5 [bacterium (Candidatus Gribaldobacteria) CG10_big_fil_rev_8_21_14_0_10_37_46]PIV14109.1 MAG: 30S ribosomal protein S5 [bacterium (Candidatus Gribaldobacteria) CG03_land_8_20_14_0_80_36_40]PJA02224.1 MAG: 30S ribosomal protein S5 [bacterium (Candidatus Gribaldobacteria) CG_4_10_14_0_2_um_filter_36_18]PJB09154.1 MAG: 30S ribosomal protein S5 [bacterium (Candidatus Gribaldobacteria
MLQKRFQQNKKEPKSEFESKLLALDRVTRVTGGGKKLRFRACVIIGNRKGKVAIGMAKGRDVAQAIEKAQRVAKKNIIEIPLIQDSIPHETEAKFEASMVLLRPQKGGRGIIAGGPVRVICDLGGVKNISAKILSRSKNKINNAMATMKALKKLKNETSSIT